MKAKKSVLLADDDPAFLRALRLRCLELDLEVQTATDGLEALLLGAKNPPELLILELNLPDVDGLSVYKKLKEDQSGPATPAIILTGQSDQETVRRCAALGAHHVHKGLEVWENLKPILCQLLAIEPAAEDAGEACNDNKVITPPSNKVLVIDDDPQITRAFMIRLGALGIEVIRAPDAKVGYLLAKSERPEVIITDYNMPGISGEQLLITLREDISTKDIPVIVVTGRAIDGLQDVALKREMLGRRGAVAYFTKPLDFDALLEQLRRHIDIED